jgi:hypothetical protein
MSHRFVGQVRLNRNRAMRSGIVSTSNEQSCHSNARSNFWPHISRAIERVRHHATNTHRIRTVGDDENPLSSPPSVREDVEAGSSAIAFLPKRFVPTFPRRTGWRMAPSREAPHRTDRQFRAEDRVKHRRCLCPNAVTTTETIENAPPNAASLRSDSS